MAIINNYNQFKQQFPLDSIKAAQLRDLSFEAFTQFGWPTKKDEAWKFTTLNHLKNTDFQFKNSTHELTHVDLKEVSLLLKNDFINIVFVDGLMNKTLSDECSEYIKIKELEISDFDFNRAESEQKLMNLAYAQLSDKIVIDINSSHLLKKPLHILFYQTGGINQSISHLTKININENCSVQAAVHFAGVLNKDLEQIVHSHLKINVSDNSSFDLVVIQNQNQNHTHLSRVVVDLHKGSQFKILDLSLGAKTSRHYTEISFLGSHAFAALYGGICLSADQHSDHYTFINHINGSNHSVQKCKSILAEKSNSVFRGRIRIEKNAQKAMSEQINNNLILSRDAQAQSVPQLEIYADDVKASHGSTTGQVSAEEMFYFLSRGIDAIQATKMLSHGFSLELIELFESSKSLRNLVNDTLLSRLNRMFP